MQSFLERMMGCPLWQPRVPSITPDPVTVDEDIVAMRVRVEVVLTRANRLLAASSTEWKPTRMI